MTLKTILFIFGAIGIYAAVWVVICLIDWFMALADAAGIKI